MDETEKPVLPNLITGKKAAGSIPSVGELRRRHRKSGLNIDSIYTDDSTSLLRQRLISWASNMFEASYNPKQGPISLEKG